jgi:hypothetical protein
MRSVLRRLVSCRALIVLAGTFVYSLSRPCAAPPTGSEPVELKVVKYDALEAAVRAQKGKVLVVDVWAEY